MSCLNRGLNLTISLLYAYVVVPVRMRQGETSREKNPPHLLQSTPLPLVGPMPASWLHSHARLRRPSGLQGTCSTATEQARGGLQEGGCKGREMEREFFCNFNQHGHVGAAGCGVTGFRPLVKGVGRLRT